MKFMIFVTLYLASASYRANAIITKYMDLYCGSTVSVTSDILLKLTTSTLYQSNMFCTVTIVTPNYHLNRIMLKFRGMDIRGPSPTCHWDSLKMYDGSSTFSSLMTGVNGLCGTTTPSRVYTTTRNKVTLNFRSSALRTNRTGSGFTILVTAYTDKHCWTSDFMCHNLRCVKKSLTCDGYNNCGDNSDEEGCGLSTGTTGTIAGEVTGAIGGTIVLVLLIVFVVVRRRAYYGRTQQTVVAPYTVSATVIHLRPVLQQQVYCYDQPTMVPPSCHTGQVQFSYPVQACQPQGHC